MMIEKTTPKKQYLLERTVGVPQKLLPTYVFSHESF